MLGKKVPIFDSRDRRCDVPPLGPQGPSGRPYFYPKDNTPGCTTEGADFRDLHKQFAKLGAVPASRGSIKSHEGFKEKMAFPFQLLSDADEKLCALFDVIKMKNMYGKKVRGIERSTFLVGPDGKLVREWRKVKVDGHATEVLDAVRML